MDAVDLFDNSLSDRQKSQTIEYFAEIFGGLKENTFLAYDSDLLIYRQFCKDRNVLMVSTDPQVAYETVRDYLKFLFEKGNNKYTIQRRLNTVSLLFKVTETYNPIAENANFAAIRKNMMANLSGQQKQATPVDGSILAIINEHFVPEKLVDVRDQAMVNCMFDGLLRSSETINMEFGDINEVDNNVLLPESKSDKEKRGTTRFLSDTSIAMVQEWKSLSGIELEPDGPIWRQMTPKGESLLENSQSVIKKAQEQDKERAPLVISRISHYRAIKRLLEKALKDSGQSTSGFSSHSMRVGAAVEMAKHGISTNVIARTGGWKSETMVLRYIRGLDARDSGTAIIAKKMNRWSKARPS